MEDMYMNEAKKMIDNIVDLAFHRLETSMSDKEKSVESIRQLQKAHNHPINIEETYNVENIEWLTVQEFNPQNGKEKIQEFIMTWQFENSWLYCVDFLSEEDHEFDKRYYYRVKWSIPTRRMPIPRATASVYFTYVVSKIRPPDSPVEVFYIFETNRLIHKEIADWRMITSMCQVNQEALMLGAQKVKIKMPGLSRFREIWLKDIIESKVKMINEVTF